MEVAVLFLGGQGAMSTHVGLQMNSPFYPDMDFSILPPTELKRKRGEMNIGCNIFKYHLCVVLCRKNGQQDVNEKQKGTV